MTKRSLIVFLLISIVLAVFTSFVYISNIQTIVEAKARTNISDTTIEVTEFLDNYVDSFYDEINTYISLNKDVSSDKSLEERMYDRYFDSNYIGFGSYNKVDEQYILNGYFGKDSHNEFKFDLISQKRVFSEKVSIIKLSHLFGNVSNDQVILFYVFDNYFAIQSFEIFEKMISNVYADGETKYLITDMSGFVYINNFNKAYSLTNIFGKIDSFDSLVDQITNLAEDAELLSIDNNRYLVSASVASSEFNKNGTVLFIFVSSSFLTSFSNSILSTTIVYVLFFVVAVLACALFVFLNKRSNKDILIPFSYDKHYVILLAPSGRIVTKNQSFAHSKFNCSNVFEKEVVELVNQTPEDLKELLINGSVLTLKDKKKSEDGILLQSALSFLIIKTRIGYQLIGTDKNEISSEITTTNEVFNASDIPDTIAEAEKNPLVGQIAYYDDIYDTFFNKKKLMKDIELLLDGNPENLKKRYVVYAGLKNRNELIKVFGHQINEMINHAFLKMIKKIARKDEIYIINDNLFAFMMDFEDDFSDLSFKMKPIEQESEKPIKVISDEIIIEPKFGIYPLALNSKDVFATAKNCLDHVMVAYENALESPYKHYLFDINSAIKSTKSIQIARDIEAGIKNDEFITNYQPIYKISEHRVSGFECLLRWNNDKYRLESPFEYIKIAERNGYIHEIGRITFRKTLDLLKDLCIDDIRISVNVSPAQFLQAGFCHDLIELIQDSGVPFRQIGIEVTETFFIERLNDVVEKLNQLRSYGMKVYLDDFGTGYSSLLYLAELPVDIIKIDKEFTIQITTNEGVRKIITHLASMANDLNIELVAEGVETKEQYEFLKAKGITYIQGYYLSKAVPVSEIRNALEYKMGGGH